VPQGHALGLVFPDRQLKWDEATRHFDFGPIDWEEFRQVVAGNGLCSKDRMRAQRKAHAEGAWVREAALAHAAKRRAHEEVAKLAAE
jgi:ring-1,2-phenylacetyl-CoA epoxidase subunit PaaA